MGGLVDMCTFARRGGQESDEGRTGAEIEVEAVLLVDGKPYLADAQDMALVKPGDVLDIGFLAVVMRPPQVGGGRICVEATRRLAYGRLRLVRD